VESAREVMYPSIKYKLLVQEVKNNFAIIRDCFEMIEFGIGNTLLAFIDTYYGYGGNIMDLKDGGLRF
jgi:hypothetical protein